VMTPRSPASCARILVLGGLVIISGRTVVAIGVVVAAVLITGWLDLPLMATALVSAGSVLFIVLVVIVAAKYLRHGMWPRR
jgi:hypothetical protein